MEHWTAEKYRDYLRHPHKYQREHRDAHQGKQISRAEQNYEKFYIKPGVADGRIKSYDTQVRFVLWPAGENGREIVFTPDFLLHMADGRDVVVEVKGKIIKRFQRDYHLRVRRFKEVYPQYKYREERAEDWT